jgi:hypothetical protein
MMRMIIASAVIRPRRSTESMLNPASDDRIHVHYTAHLWISGLDCQTLTKAPRTLALGRSQAPVINRLNVGSNLLPGKLFLNELASTTAHFVELGVRQDG